MQDFFIEKESKRLDTCPVDTNLQAVERKKQIIRPHIHSAIEILIVKEGAYSIFVGGRQYTAYPGDMVLLRSSTIHHTYSIKESRSSYYVIKVRPSLLAELSDGEGDSKALLFFSLDKPSRKCFWTAEETKKTRLFEIVTRYKAEFENKNKGRSIALTLCVADMLLEILRSESEKEEESKQDITDSTIRRIYEVLIYINSNYSLPITAQECSEKAGMSYSYFSRTFKAVVGKSFKEYLNFTRINHAQKTLLSTDKTVTETAALCGFDNVSYFISVYKKIKGVTPLSNRKN